MRNRLWMVSGLAAVAVLAAACGGSSGSAGSSSSSAPSSASNAGSQSVVLKTAKTSLGLVLTDAKGFTLYWYAPDSSTMSNCTGSCASTWPPVMGLPQAAPGVSLMGKFGTINRSDGTTQATYGGHPLYRYALDSKPGMTSGNGVGGVWHVVKASGGGAVSSPAPSTASSSSGGGGYGY